MGSLVTVGRKAQMNELTGRKLVLAGGSLHERAGGTKRGVTLAVSGQHPQHFNGDAAWGFAMTAKVTCQVRIMAGKGVGMGPGKAAMLRAIQATRSINAAGKEFGMSYRRAWLLVEEMNQLFASPLVIARRGGKGGGGAEVTPLGERVLREYEQLQKLINSSGEFRALSRLLGTGRSARGG